MQFHESLFSLQLERNILGGLMNFQDSVIELSHMFTEKEFYERTHSVIFQVLRNCVLSGQKIDKVLLAQKVKELGISAHHDINIFEYLDDLSYIKLNKDGIVQSAKELIRLRFKRDTWEDTLQTQKMLKESGNKGINELVTEIDTINTKRIMAISNEENPQDVFLGINDEMDAIAKNPSNESGLITPYKEFNRLFGGIRHSNGLLAVVSRPKEGKSTWLQNLAQGVVALNPGCKVLILDTEMDVHLTRFRMASSLTGVPYWFYETGNWVKNKDLVVNREKLREQEKLLKGKIFHKAVPNKSIEEICSIIRRWFYQEVKRGGKALVIYDYIKLGGNDKLSNSNLEYQLIGQKIDALNTVGKELQVPIFSAMQLNRAGEDLRDDGAAISVSDRLAWYASFVAIFRKKSLDEIAQDGQEWGSHKLIPLYTRFQGKDAYGTHDLVKVMDHHTNKPKFKKNFINYTVDSFRIIEKGSLNDIIRQQQLQGNLQGNSQQNDNNHI